jgi:hypothetical protein
VLEAPIVSTKSLSMEEVKARGWEAERESRLRP